jgi:hypothetical protein
MCYLRGLLDVSGAVGAFPDEEEEDGETAEAEVEGRRNILFTTLCRNLRRLSQKSGTGEGDLCCCCCWRSLLLPPLSVLPKGCCRLVDILCGLFVFGDSPSPLGMEVLRLWALIPLLAVGEDGCCWWRWLLLPLLCPCMLLLLLLPPPTATAGAEGVFGLLLVVLLGLVGPLLPGNPTIPNGLIGTSNDFWYASRLPYAMIPV